ncbi:MAG: hypothetical protein K0Q49_2139 [Haloplasmataceae bacterium]|jgi:AraC-like DNA-binding protein|nr:hypothetical protein [Haloplasmataceae bacterium]
MRNNNYEVFKNITPAIFHIANRQTKPDWKINNHKFARFKFVVIYDGKGYYDINGEKFTGTKGDFIFFKPGDVSNVNTEPDDLLKFYTVNFEYTCPVNLDHLWSLSTPDLPFKTIQKIKDPLVFSRICDYFEELTKLWITEYPNKHIQLRILFIEIIYSLLSWVNKEEYNYDKYRKTDIMIDFLNERYNQKITLNELGNLLEVSPSYAGAIFKEITGKTPIQYLHQVRINKAKQLLLEGYSITDISNEVGFNDLFYFSKYFKKYEGVSPSEFKNLSIYNQNTKNQN